MQIEITVRFLGGAHVTNTVKGVRASSTADGATAAERFGVKYFGDHFVGAALVRRNETGVEVWSVVGRDSPEHGGNGNG